MSQNQSQYFDLVTRGVGYMKRFRIVNPDKSRGQKFKPFCSVSICAVVGDADDKKYVTYDVNIKGAQAQEAIKVLKAHLVGADGKALEKKVFVGFSIGDAIPETYTYKSNGVEKTGVSMKGRLLKLHHATVDGVRIELPMTEHDQQQQSSESDDSGENQA